MKVYGLSITTLCPHKLRPIVENTVVIKHRNNKVNKIYLKIIAGHSHCLASHYHWTQHLEYGMCSVEMEKNSFSELHLVSFLLMILYVLSSLKVTFRVGIQNSAGYINTYCLRPQPDIFNSQKINCSSHVGKVIKKCFC